jgi:iron complex outermembrane receptor protein
MPSPHRICLAALAGGLACLATSAHAQVAWLEPIVVVAPREHEPLTVITDPKRPRQPLPAHDGADYLKTIPGFSVIRKGGTDGDPVLRGMAGSRLGILLDGEQILGGCGGRMDPPTAYVFPEAYDRVTVIKGPQGVIHAAGASAGTVLFEREPDRFSAPGWRGHASALAGSFGRHDEVIDAAAGTPRFQARVSGTRTSAGDYEDGDGRRVHSRYERWSANTALAWTPDERTRLELTAAASDGEAAYADRMMDGVAFERTNAGVRLRRENLSPLVEKVDVHAWRNYVDHVMDNFTLRDVAMGAARAVSNPDRETRGAKALAGLRLGADRVVLGADWQANDHTLRSTMNQAAMPYQAKPRMEDARFSNRGVFGEWTHPLGDVSRTVAGLRVDRWSARDERRTLGLGTGSSAVTLANPTGEKTRSDTLTSGFARIERELPDSRASLYAGIGHVERFPDYWELFNREGETSPSAFGTRPEKTTQVDVGVVRSHGEWTANLSAFAGAIDDYILIQSHVGRTGPIRTAVIARNIDARSVGLEAGAGRKFATGWKADATLAWVRGENRTDGTPLAQQPPLEARLAIAREDPVWSLAMLLRAVARQGRVDRNRGNIAGQDIGPSAGFAIFSVNGAWRIGKRATLSAGVDNVFDRVYAEHLSRAGAMVPGFLQTTRVNEPGRSVWAKLQVAFQ